MVYLNCIIFINFFYVLRICEGHQAETTHIHVHVIFTITGKLQKTHFLLNKIFKYSL